MVILAVLLCIVALLLWYARSPLRPWLELVSFERQVKKHVDPMELQQWATNLIAQHSGEMEHRDEYSDKKFNDGTNFPLGLKKVGCFRQGMYIFTDERQRSVGVFGMGDGGPFLKVGSSSLAAPTNQTFILWKPGIYFVGE